MQEKFREPPLEDTGSRPRYDNEAVRVGVMAVKKAIGARREPLPTRPAPEIAEPPAPPPRKR